MSSALKVLAHSVMLDLAGCFLSGNCLCNGSSSSSPATPTYSPWSKCKAAAKKRKRNKVKSHLRLVQVNVAHNSSESHILLCTEREQRKSQKERREVEKGGGGQQQQRGNIAHTCDSAQSWAMARDKASETDKDGVREGDEDRAGEQAMH